MSSFITPLPANQSDVQQNWAITITGSINLDGFNYVVLEAL
jgi:hypothetical protein